LLFSKINYFCRTNINLSIQSVKEIHHMRKTIFIMLIAALLASCTGKKGEKYTINGVITGMDTGMIYLQKRDLGKWIRTDSTRIKDGKFMFTGKVAIAEMRYRRLHQKRPHFHSLSRILSFQSQLTQIAWISRS
jgi:hypothetical protein